VKYYFLLNHKLSLYIKLVAGAFMKQVFFYHVYMLLFATSISADLDVNTMTNGIYAVDN